MAGLLKKLSVEVLSSLLTERRKCLGPNTMILALSRIKKGTFEITQDFKSSEKATLQHSLTPGQNPEKLHLFQMEKPQSQTKGGTSSLSGGVIWGSEG